MALKNIIGQETATTALLSAIRRDAVPQAYLFVGPDGSGKTATALEFVKALNCKSRTPEGDACDACVNCSRVAEGQYPDLARIAPDGENTRIWQFWTRPGHPPGALESLPFRPVAGRVRAFLIEKAETLNEESANSMLKALEEPPSYVNFVLCAPSPTAVLPTILSRSQMIRFRQVPTAVIADALAERRSLPPSEARVIAAYAQGAPGRALRLADAPELREQREALLDLAEKVAHSPGIAAFKLAEQLRNTSKPAAASGGKGKKGAAAGGDDADTADSGGADRTARGDLGRSLDVLGAWHADMLSVALRGPDAPVVHEDRRKALQAAAARYRPEQLAENIEHLFKFRRYLARNANTQLATEVLMLKLVPKKGG